MRASLLTFLVLFRPLPAQLLELSAQPLADLDDAFAGTDAHVLTESDRPFAHGGPGADGVPGRKVPDASRGAFGQVHRPFGGAFADVSAALSHLLARPLTLFLLAGGWLDCRR